MCDYCGINDVAENARHAQDCPNNPRNWGRPMEFANDQSLPGRYQYGGCSWQYADTGNTSTLPYTEEPEDVVRCQVVVDEETAAWVKAGVEKLESLLHK